jgi:hypothetical protein
MITDVLWLSDTSSLDRIHHAGWANCDACLNNHDLKAGAYLICAGDAVRDVEGVRRRGRTNSVWSFGSQGSLHI